MIRKRLCRAGVIGGVAIQALLLPALAFAQSNDEEAMLVLAVVGVILLFALVVSFAILAFICWFVSGALKELPAEYRTVEPGHVWLLLIPCFSLVWNFFVYPKVSESFENYFRATGQGMQYGDCSKELGRWYCICCCLSMIPYVGGLAGMAGLVLLIIFLVKLNEYKKAVMANPDKMAMG